MLIYYICCAFESNFALYLIAGLIKALGVNILRAVAVRAAQMVPNHGLCLEAKSYLSPFGANGFNTYFDSDHNAGILVKRAKLSLSGITNAAFFGLGFFNIRHNFHVLNIPRGIIVKLILALLMHKPFAELHINDLQMIKEHFCERKFNKGDVLIREGELANSIGILCEGSATALLERESQKIYDLNVSDFYGVPSLLKMQVSDVTIVCNLTTVGYILKADEFFKIIGRFPDIRAYFYNLTKKRSQTSKTDTARQPHSRNNLTDETVNHPKCILKALQFIDVNFADQISLENLSSEIGISRYYLSHLFKKTTGRSFKQHLNIRRIKAAKCLMLEEDMNVSEACFAAGFNNLSYFIRVFKQYEKIRPSDYRRKFEIKKTSFDS